MNDERDNGTTDRQVSDIYRELADERVPQRLDDKVLRMAAGAKTPRNIIPGLWMKPIAWAATIGLSLAIVLELTQTPSISPDMSALSPSMSVDETGALAPARGEILSETAGNDLRDRQLQADDTAVSEPPPSTELREQDPARRDFKPKVPRAEMPVKEEAAAQALSVAPEPVEAAAAEDGLAATDADEGSFRRAGKTAAVSSMAVTAEKMLIAEPSLCPADVRESADEWYGCIVAKRATSPKEAVDTELAAFRKRFPDYRVPAVDR